MNAREFYEAGPPCVSRAVDGFVRIGMVSILIFISNPQNIHGPVSSCLVSDLVWCTDRGASVVLALLAYLRGHFNKPLIGFKGQCESLGLFEAGHLTRSLSLLFTISLL